MRVSLQYHSNIPGKHISGKMNTPLYPQFSYHFSSMGSLITCSTNFRVINIINTLFFFPASSAASFSTLLLHFQPLNVEPWVSGPH